ncbi:hypothetical protein OS493_026478 [Desmophyllum pertusum]|uniref:Uncharacterized protein n=1 Tax=Desmophyllum pertusum TaxID=174260 RepID=A0A9W9YXQ0_9CNID|nr:hypothetical protein OS493_026478 [Desmophyllum pertusum]
MTGNQIIGIKYPLRPYDSLYRRQEVVAVPPVATSILEGPYLPLQMLKTNYSLDLMEYQILYIMAIPCFLDLTSYILYLVFPMRDFMAITHIQVTIP